MKKALVILILFGSFFQGLHGQKKDFEFRKTRFSFGADSELGPAWYGEGGLVYISNKSSTGAVEYTDAQGNRLSNIYFLEDPDSRDAKILSPALRTPSHDGPITFARNDSVACFVRQYGYSTPGFNETGNAGLYFAYKTNDVWGNITPFEHNSEDLNFFSPSLSRDGQTLYFAASNMDDSFGGWDIYVSRLENGKWTYPENLGSNINTPEYDAFPFIHPSGKLYFSSEGHGASRKDIFYSVKYNGEWLPAVPYTVVNTRNDDYSLIISDDYSEGYLARKINTGVQSDIWRFSYPVDVFEYPRPIQRNRFCFRLRENSLDTIDYEVFSYEWVINDTLSVPGHDIKFCFPGPGEYNLSFNVTNKLTDTVMVGVASLFLQLELVEQPVISCPDTIYAGQEVEFSARETEWSRFEIGGYYWDFGEDGDKLEGLVVRKTFPFPGKYKVVLGILEKKRNPDDAERASVFKEIEVLPVE